MGGQRLEEPKIPGGKLVLCKRLRDIKDTVLDVGISATPRRFRLVDCRQFMQRNELSIYEFEEFPTVPYAAVSYVWKGNSLSPEWQDQLGTFSVNGALDGDPISMDVLKSVCEAVSLGRTFLIGPFLWLDRLCILQTDKQDKAWQITHMYEIYKRCMVCVVLPGGIRRLVRLDEETGWIHRGWTLQETLAPEKVIVIFQYSRNFFDMSEVVDDLLKKCDDCDGQQFNPIPQDANAHPFLEAMKKSGTCAWMPLNTILEAATTNTSWELTDMKNKPTIIGSPTTCELLLLSRTASMSGYQGRQDWREQAIWRSSFIRTSSRPVDMVFSIMQLFDITLDPTAFDKDDRLGATIALASEILRRGKSASWLGSLFTLESSPQLCTFPRFPMTSVDGKARVQKGDGNVVEMVEEIETIATFRWLDHVPGGSMDERGYFIFTSPAVRICRVSDTQAPGVDQHSGPVDIDGYMHFAAEDNSIWRLHPKASDDEVLDNHPRVFAVLLGMQAAHIGDRDPESVEGDAIALIIEEHAPERFHKVSCYLFWQSFNYLLREGMERQFHLGGPDA